MRWLSEQLEAANTRNAQETDYMSAQLESERYEILTEIQDDFRRFVDEIWLF